MENRMRDLDQIQERDADDRGRKLGTVLLATASVVGLTFAMGVVVGRAAEPSEPEAKDPLDQLDPAAALRDDGDDVDDDEEAEAQAPRPPKVEPTELSFPKTLTEEEDRPEVLAALHAAALEEAALAQPEGLEAQGLQEMPEAAIAAGIRLSDPIEEPEPGMPMAAEELVAAVPAAVAAGAGETLQQSAQHDPMVAQALRTDRAEGPRAPRGMDGEFTLQVISYDSREPAEAFADGLRAKGHEAFVVKADIPDRGRFFRVRIGPFENRYKAETYRRKFEDEERMNTFIVRRKPDEA